jgi:hypothetical protein
MFSCESDLIEGHNVQLGAAHCRGALVLHCIAIHNCGQCQHVWKRVFVRRYAESSRHKVAQLVHSKFLLYALKAPLSALFNSAGTTTLLLLLCLPHCEFNHVSVCLTFGVSVDSTEAEYSICYLPATAAMSSSAVRSAYAWYLVACCGASL